MRCLLFACLLPTVAVAQVERDVSHWIGQLSSEDVVERKVAIRALVKAGPAAVPKLITTLEEIESDEEWNDVIGLGGGAGGRFQRVDPLAIYRVWGTVAGWRGDLSSLCRWPKETLTSDSGLSKPRHKRVLAAYALGRIGTKASAAIPALVDAMHDRKAGVARQATWALAQIGEAAVPALLEHVQSWRAKRALIALGSKARRSVIELVRSGKRARSIAAAISVLAARAPEAHAEVVPLLIDKLAGQNVVAQPAMAGLADFDDHARVQIEKSVQNDPRALVRLRGLATLCRFMSAESCVDTALARLRDGDDKVQRYAAEALGKMGKLHATRAARANVIRALADAYENGQLLLRVSVLVAIADLATDDRPSPDLVATALGESAWQLRGAALRCLRRGDTDRFGARVVSQLQQPARRQIRNAALEAIVRMQPRGATGKRAAAVIADLWEKRQSVQDRDRLLDVVGSLGAEATPLVPLVTKQLTLGNIPLRIAAAEAAGCLGKVAKPTLPALRKMARGRSKPAKDAARKAIAAIEAAVR